MPVDLNLAFNNITSDINGLENKWQKQDIAMLLGNVVDQFETALYGLLVPVLSPLFFPGHSAIVQIILAYSILGTGIVTRPIGAIIFGWLARRFSPQVGLSYSIFGVAIATVAMAVLPNFSAIGWIAPTMLLLIRIIKGIFAAGENTIARLHIVEAKTETMALKAAYYYETATMVGIIAASVAANIVIFCQGQQIIWRLCFLCSGVLGGIAYVIRTSSRGEKPRQMMKDAHSIASANKLNNSVNTNSHAQKSYGYTSCLEKQWVCMADLRNLWHQRVNTFKIFFICGFSYLTYIIPFILFNSLVPLLSEVTLEAMLQLNTMFLVLDLLLIPIIGYYISKYMLHNIDQVMLCAAIVLASTMIPLFMLLPNTSLGFVIFFRCWIVFWGIVFLCPLNLWYGRLLHSSQDRFLILGLGDALATGTIGHLSPAICLGLWHTTGSILAPAIYVTVLMLGAIMVLLTSYRANNHLPIYI